jgi:hypothetical protein
MSNAPTNQPTDLTLSLQSRVFDLITHNPFYN